MTMKEKEIILLVNYKTAIGQFKVRVDIIEKEFKKKGGNLTRLNREMMADVATKAIVELYRTFWLRRSFWENQVKIVT